MSGTEEIVHRIDRRTVLKHAGVGGAAVVAWTTTGAAADDTATEAPSTDAYESILDDADGSGSEDDPYVLTDVVELQAMQAAPDAHYELGGTIDASITHEWNETTAITDEVGRGFDREFYLSYRSFRESTVELLLDGSPVDERSYTLESDGRITVEEELSDEAAPVVATYTLSEPVFRGFVPIGDGDNDPFTGHFDGRGHEIRGLAVDRVAAHSVGLFASLQGTVRNLALVEADANGTSRVGALAGHCSDAVVRNVSVTGTVDGNDREETEERSVGGAVGTLQESTIEATEADVDVTGTDSVGGLVGGATESSVTNCRASGDVISLLSTDIALGGRGSVGGLVGSNWEGEIRESSATGDVVGVSQVGGLVGSANDEGRIVDCYATGAVDGGDGNHIGGLTGEIQASTVERSYAVGEVTGDSSSVGGLTGFVRQGGDDAENVLRASYWADDLVTQSASYGRIQYEDNTTVEDIEALSAAEMRGESAESTMSALDFEATWRSSDSDEFPELRARLEEIGSREPVTPTPTATLEPTPTEPTDDDGGVRAGALAGVLAGLVGGVRVLRWLDGRESS